MPNVSLVQSLDRTSRVNRRPQHTFNLAAVPYEIQPFLLAPVLPGETMRNLLMQARVVTDPITNPLIGWWLEYYFFYVKHRDLAIRDALTDMVLDPSWSAATAGISDAAADAFTYFAGNGINWAKHCLERVTECYFRDEGDAWDAHVLDGLPLASISGNSWLDSAMLRADYDATTAGGPDPLITLQDATHVGAKEIEDGLRQWEFMRAANMTTMTYEEFLASYGVRVKLQEEHRPELVRYVKEWSYPTNTVDPATGAPSSAVSWSVAERADKDRFFSEPGFLFGVTVARPKVYLKAQKGSAAWLMRNAYTWLPAVLAGDVSVGITPVAQADGPLGGLVSDANGYVADVRDLLVYGDQFVNYASTATAKNFVALPAADLQKRYAALADIQAMFVNAAGNKQYVRHDGVVSLTIAGSQKDMTPTATRLRHP